MGRRLDWTRTSWENRYCVAHHDIQDPLYREGTRIIEEAARADAERKAAEEREQQAERRRLRAERKAERRRRKREMELQLEQSKGHENPGSDGSVEDEAQT